MYDLDEVDVGRALWLAEATDESFLLLLDIVANPPWIIDPDPWGYWRGRKPDYWENAPVAMLGEWVRRNPDMAIPQIGSLLCNPHARSIAIDTLYEAQHPSSIPLLKSLVEQWDQLSEDELLSLIDTLGESNHADALPPLKQLQILIPSDRTVIHKEINLFLS
jgi:hypothetical protein